MSGFGERFRKVGYTVPKPLIEIEGKPIIGHVIDMFPGEQDFIFICNQDHLNNPDYKMEAVLQQYCPTGRIIGIPAHKLGPIHAVHQVEGLIDLDRPVVVNYCDFTCYWSWPRFKEFVTDTNCVGAIPAYKGFHPHTLGSTNYAYMREENGWVQDIQEKQHYTDDRMNEFASSGTYYFSSGKVMSDAFVATMEQELNVGGEYYVSLAYKSLLDKNLLVAVYPIQHFMQWGTPGDVDEYNNWSASFKRLLLTDDTQTKSFESLVIPMAGLGQRFVNESYVETKPLIPVSGLPMVLQATHCLPSTEKCVFVLRKDMDGYGALSSLLKTTFKNVIIKELEEVTNGQATTALIGLEALEEEGDLQGFITFGACDFGSLYSTSKLQELMDDSHVDIIVWGVRGNANAVRNPHMFGWIDESDGVINNISVKIPPERPENSPIVLGTFTFRSSDVFHSAIERMYKREGVVNGEYYLDTMINDAITLGMKCRLFEVDSYFSWGTPNDLRTFEYWQSCFHKWESHPYRLELDVFIPSGEVDKLEETYKASVPWMPSTII
jgi:dTDP-glucose pyrophosphorylase